MTTDTSTKRGCAISNWAGVAATAIGTLLLIVYFFGVGSRLFHLNQK